MAFGLPFKLTDYLELVDYTGRILRDDKRASISNNLPPILQRLGIEANNWLTLTTSFENNFKDLVGCPSALCKVVELLDRKRRPSFNNCKTLFS